MHVHWCGEEQTLAIHSLQESRAGGCGIDSMGRMSKKSSRMFDFVLMRGEKRLAMQWMTFVVLVSKV